MEHHLGSNCIRSLPAKGRIAGYTELAWISQRVMRISSSDACRFRRTVFMEYRAGLPGSVRLGPGELHHLGPLLGFVGQKFAELGGRARKHRPAHVGKARPDLGIGE